MAEDTNKQVHALIDTVPKGLFLDGEFIDAEGKETFEVFNPADGSVLAKVASASAADCRRGLDAICNAQESWSQKPRRGSALRSCAAPSSSFPSAPTTSRCSKLWSSGGR